ncbi:MAG: helix-turn-helix domain-containing protein [Betaproteobacteria bacterium]|nr:helix-turn-helix domain-containing protein [Betaproteobacteria bacterium]
MVATPGRVTPYPRIPGHEIAGEIVAVGSEVKSFKTGQRVTNHFYLRRKVKSGFKLSIAALMGACTLPCMAQSYPAKPVRVLIVFPPGGSNDVTARIAFSKMAAITGQQFVLENRGGAAGTIGAEVVAKSPPDGYTVMVQSTTHIANAHLYKKLPYDTLKDFIGVTTLARQVGVLLVHPSLPVRTGKELSALAKKRPNDLTYASSGNGSYAHMAMALFMSMANIKMLHIQYKGGGPANIALVAGETPTLLTSLGSVVNYIKQGRARALAESARPGVGSRVLTEALLKQCLVLALRRWIELEASPLPLLPWLAGVADTRLSRALHAVFEQPAAAFTVEGLAMIAAMSRSAFAAAFRRAFGQSPMSLVKLVRLRRASELLVTTALPVADVAKRVGFSSRSNFSLAFSQLHGMDPSRFRRTFTVTAKG